MTAIRTALGRALIRLGRRIDPTRTKFEIRYAGTSFYAPDGTLGVVETLNGVQHVGVLPASAADLGRC